MGTAVALFKPKLTAIDRSIGHLISLALEEWKWDAIPIDELPRLISFSEQRSAMYEELKSARGCVLQFEWRKRAEGLLQVLKKKRNR